MTDFNGTELKFGDKVVIAYNKYGRTQLLFGTIRQTDIKQANMLMAEVEIQLESYTTTTRVASWNIYKKD